MKGQELTDALKASLAERTRFTAAECDAFVLRALGNAYWNKDRVTADELAIAHYALQQIEIAKDGECA